MRRSSHARSTSEVADQALVAIDSCAAGRPASLRSGGLRRFKAVTVKLQLALPRDVSAYTPSEAELEQSTEISSLVTMSDSNHYRMLFSKCYGTGHSEFCGLADGLFVFLTDMVFTEPYAMSVSAPDLLRIRIASDGDGEYAAGQGDLLNIKGPGAAIIIEPAGAAAANVVFAGRHTSVHVYVHRDALLRLYGRDETELPGVLRAFVAGTLQRTVARRLPLSPSLLRCLEDLQGCGLEGRSRWLMMRSKATEILCHAFDALAQEENGSSLPEASALAANGVLKAQRLLMENFVSPPSLDVLASQVGLSRSSLCAAFRQIVGQTVFDYIADLRMQHALALLNQPHATISEVAYAVGYGHPSSFSVAVQRRFGTTASELRRRGLPFV